jgi:NAD(P)H-hydrate epimerase
MATTITISVEEMQRLEAMAETQCNIPTFVLMKNAGKAVADVCRALCKKTKISPKVYIFCGVGNNGGDGIACGRFLSRAGIPQETVLLVNPASLKDDPLAHFELLKKYGYACTIADTPRLVKTVCARIKKELRHSPAIVIDALFGTGLNRAPQGIFAYVIKAINSFDALVVSVDCPSGAALGQKHVFSPCVRADVTVSLGFLKRELRAARIRPLCGKIIVKDIGIPIMLLDEIKKGQVPD